MEKISETIRETIEIDRNVVKNKALEIDRKIYDYLNFKEKYSDIPYEISKILEEINLDQIEENEGKIEEIEEEDDEIYEEEEEEEEIYDEEEMEEDVKLKLFDD